LKKIFIKKSDFYWTFR